MSPSSRSDLAGRPGVGRGAVYLPLWYTVAKGLPFFDFMNAIRVEGQPTGLPPAVVLVAVVFLVGAMRRLSRE